MEEPSYANHILKFSERLNISHKGYELLGDMCRDMKGNLLTIELRHY